MGAIQLSDLEQAAGLVAGPDPAAAALPPPDARPARAVLESVIGEALRGQCFVSFSGGRDSSAVLATAVAVARREGLPAPVPVSLRFPGITSTDETDWQELVVRHLGVEDWVRIEIGSEVDLLGDLACAALRRHGLLWPPNAVFHAPIFQVARGACVLTGFDGDGLLLWRWAHPASVLAGRVRPVPRDLARVAMALAPPAARRPILSGRPLPPVTWLQPEAHRRFARQWVRASTAEPFPWAKRMEWYAARRYRRLTAQSLAVIAGDHGASGCHPLGDPRFLSALGRDGGRWGWGSRTEAMGALFGDLLPRELIERSRKAEFGRAMWGARARAFAAEWDGTGLNGQLVDADRLRFAWSADNPVFASATPLHAAWLASETASRPAGRD